MSKGGGAGKVYFVLYLAVVLELLIIIVERDEAEEHLHKKQKEAMRIVESILTQMQSGAGTEGMTTRPQDEITIPPPGINIEEIMGSDIKSYREYIVEVGVTDVTSAIQKRELESESEFLQRLQKLVQLANVEQLQYQLFYNPDKNPDFAPYFPNEDYFRRLDLLTMEPGVKLQPANEGDFDPNWEFLGVRELNMDLNTTFRNLNLNDLSARNINPVYPAELSKVVGADYSPSEIPYDSVFSYVGTEISGRTPTIGTRELQKRAFRVFFQPPSNAGWYKLRFASRTNRILGVRAGQEPGHIEDDATVNIGTVQLSVGNLRQVQRELALYLDKFEIPDWQTFIEESFREGYDALLEFHRQLDNSKRLASLEPNADEMVARVDLYGYIAQLLAPGQSSNFDQNRSSMEFNIRVITPQPKLADPVISLTDYIATFDQVPAVFQFDISPYQDGNVVTGRVQDQTGTTVARLDLRPLDQIAGLNVPSPIQGQKREYRATVDKTLIPGKYEVEMTHQLMSKASTQRAVLEVFPTALTDDSHRELDNRISALSFYGYPLTLNAVPTSGGKIKSDQFRIYVSTDDDAQRSPYQSLNISGENAITFRPSSKEVSVRIAWVQPYTNTEVDLFPLKKYPIRQMEPNINDRTMRIDISGTATRLVVNIDNITVSKPTTGSETHEARVQLQVVGEPQITDGLAGYQLAVEPSITDLGDGNYSIYFELAGQLERGQTKVTGNVRVNLRAVAVNPVNGVVSEPQNRNINVQIDYSPDRGGGRPRRR